MQSTAHLTEEQFARYLSRTLAPAELLAVDEHVEVCDTCRERLYQEGRAGSRIRELRAGLSLHLEYEEIVACAGGTADPELERHLRDCEMCRAEVEDLRQFQGELERTPMVMPARRRLRWVPAVVAAGVAISAGLAFRYVRRDAPAVEQARVAEAALSAEETEAVQMALRTRRLEWSPILEQLAGKRGVQLGGAPEEIGFVLTSPLGTAVVADRPIFRWKAATGATGYEVAIFDENFEEVAKSPRVTTTEWQPEQGLPRGRIYNWQVTASIGGKTVNAPAPPAPEARFQVVSAATAGELEVALRQHPSNHTLLAVLYARAGVVEEADLELDHLDPVLSRELRKKR